VKFYTNTKINQFSQDISMDSHNFLGVDPVKNSEQIPETFETKRGKIVIFWN
jgi:hypothetical protein